MRSFGWAWDRVVFFRAALRDGTCRRLRSRRMGRGGMPSAGIALSIKPTVLSETRNLGTGFATSGMGPFPDQRRRHIVLAHVEIENRMSTTSSTLRAKGSRNPSMAGPSGPEAPRHGFLPRSLLTGRRIRAAAESVEVFIDQTSHESTVRRHAIRLQRRCEGNQRRPRSLRLDGVASSD